MTSEIVEEKRKRWNSIAPMTAMYLLETNIDTYDNDDIIIIMQTYRDMLDAFMGCKNELKSILNRLQKIYKETNLYDDFFISFNQKYPKFKLEK